MKKYFKKPCLFSCFLIVIIIIFLFTSFNTFSKTYVIKDKEGNVVKMTSICKMSIAEKEAGYTISVLIEDKFPKEELNPPPGSKLTNAVLRVIDGDTIELLLIKSFKFVKIRLDGIDCPEKGQPYYEEATAYTSNLCLRKQVRVIKHDIDKYDRLIADIILPDGKNLSEELVRAGLAWWYYLYSDDLILKKLESEAKNTRKGLWFQFNPIPPWEFRKID
jgi:endonuclease YncB( thermonuclease family)